MADSWDASGSSRTSSAAGEALRGRKKKYKRYKTKFSHSKALKKREALPPPPLDSSMDEQHDGAAAMQERQERQERQGAGGDGSGKETLVNRDCLCTCIRDGKVYRGRILQHQGDRLLVHYLGWNSKHDEWVKQKRVLQIMEQDAKGEVAGRGGKKKVGGPLRFSDPLLFVCYECYEGGKLLSCDACPRRFHRECMGQAQDESAGGGETKDDGWVCSMCATPADRVSFAERVNKLQQACEKFHMKHAAATFGRQFVRVSELYAQCVSGKKDVKQILQFASAQEAIEGLTRMASEAGEQEERAASKADPLVSGFSVLSQPGGSDMLHCDVCGYSRVEVGCSTCSAAFHLRCLNLEQRVNGDVPPDWRCRICLHEASLTTDAMRSIETFLQAENSLLLPAISSPAADQAAKATQRGRKRPGNEQQAEEQQQNKKQQFQEQEEQEQEICGLGVSRAKMPEEAVLCCSCGFFEQESICCDVCLRWFCFGCTCLSLQTLPAGSFTCPECLGIEQYDEQLAASMSIVRGRIREGKVCLQEVDMFAQTVYDLLATCAWKEFKSNLEVLIELVQLQISRHVLPTILPFHSVHYPLSKDIVRDIAKAHSNQKLQDVKRAEKVKEKELKLFKDRSSRSSSRLKIGYVSADFVNHPTADLMQSALLLHDTSKFEIFLYSITRNDSSMYRRVLQREIPNFRLLPNAKNDKACAQMIADDDIDILINLNSHTAGERNGIFAFRPAPLQVVYLAYPGTHGASYLDYNVVDKTVSPREHRELYTESLIYMPHCYQTNSFQDLYREVLSSSCLPSRRDHGLPEQAVVFCTFNRLGRITPDVFRVWTRILERVPNSVLWLYKHPTMAVLRLLREARSQNIDSSRFVFAGPMMPKIEHLKRLTLADVYLDTLIYNGHTTGSDFLWAGVPMVTIQGDSFPSRVGASLARAVGMPEMIATTLREYEEMAVELGNNKNALEGMKAKLREARLTAPLFDTARWVGSFEDALEKIWERHEQGLEPCDVFPKDPGEQHKVLSDSSSTKKWKEEKGDAFGPDPSKS